MENQQVLVRVQNFYLMKDSDPLVVTAQNLALHSRRNLFLGSITAPHEEVEIKQDAIMNELIIHDVVIHGCSRQHLLLERSFQRKFWLGESRLT